MYQDHLVCGGTPCATQPKAHKLQHFSTGLLPCSHLTEIRMRSHRLPQLGDNKSAPICQPA